MSAAAVDFLHDFVHIFWPSVRAVADEQDPVAGYFHGPFLLVELCFFGLFPLDVAKWLWFASSLLEVAALVFFGAQLLGARARSASLLALGTLALTSVPILDSLLYGQLGVMAALGITLALYGLQDEDEAGGELLAGIFLGVTVAAKPSWLPWLLLFPALRRWRAARVSVVTLALAHASALLLFGAGPVWRVVEVSVERAAELRATIMNAPDSQHLAHVAQRWLHALFGSEDGSAAARLAWLTPLSLGLGGLGALTLVWRGARDAGEAAIAIVLISACVVPTSWPLDFCMLPLLTAVAIERALRARSVAAKRGALVAIGVGGVLCSVLARAFPQLRSDTAGACLAASLAIAAAFAFTTRARPRRRAAAPTGSPGAA